MRIFLNIPSIPINITCAQPTYWPSTSLTSSMSLPAECIVLSVTSATAFGRNSRRISSAGNPRGRAFHPRPFRLYWARWFHHISNVENKTIAKLYTFLNCSSNLYIHRWAYPTAPIQYKNKYVHSPKSALDTHNKRASFGQRSKKQTYIILPILNHIVSRNNSNYIHISI